MDGLFTSDRQFTPLGLRDQKIVAEAMFTLYRLFSYFRVIGSPFTERLSIEIGWNNSTIHAQTEFTINQKADTAKKIIQRLFTPVFQFP